MSVFSNTSKDAPELRAQYAAAVLGLIGDSNPVDVLRETPGAVARAVATLTPEKLRTPEAPGKWSVARCCATSPIPTWCGDGGCG